MLILCSNGLSSKHLRMQVREALPNPCHRAALVVTAADFLKKQDPAVPRCADELRSLGLSVTLFDIDDQDPRDLMQYDVVEFMGGNPFYLMNSIRRRKAAPVLRRLAKERVLIGWSAAAFVFGPTLKLVHTYTPEMNTVGLKDLRGLALTDIEALPHYDHYTRLMDRFEEKCALYEAQNDTCVVRLNDGEGVILSYKEPN